MVVHFITAGMLANMRESNEVVSGSCGSPADSEQVSPDSPFVIWAALYYSGINVSLFQDKHRFSITCSLITISYLWSDMLVALD
jgi:hypothetical protein